MSSSPTTSVAPSSSVASLANGSTIGSTVATPTLTPAAAARAKKIAAGGMDFVERPGSVFVSPRNLAPPPPKPIDALIAAGTPALPVPSLPSFSFIRWFCTSRTVWAWMVRGITLSMIAAMAYVAYEYYRAWHARMERWHSSRQKFVAASAQIVQPPQIQSSSSSNAVPAAATSPSSTQSSTDTSSNDGAANFRALTELISTRYAMLNQYAAVLKHIRASDTALASTTSQSLSPTDQQARITAVFDELDSALTENAYLRGLLKRINGSLKKTGSATTTASQTSV